MMTLPDIFTTYAPESIERYPHLPASHHKAMDAICHCRTGAYGYNLYTCESCGQVTAPLPMPSHPPGGTRRNPSP
jgi:hypothetical protein